MSALSSPARLKRLHCSPADYLRACWWVLSVFPEEMRTTSSFKVEMSSLGQFSPSARRKVSEQTCRNLKRVERFKSVGHGHQAAHGDGAGLNNRLANLRWATRRENEADKIKHGTHQ
jgi:hypothetical protein